MYIFFKDKKAQQNAKKDKEFRLLSKHNDDKKHSQSSFLMAGYMIFSLNEIRRHQWMLNNVCLKIYL